MNVYKFHAHAPYQVPYPSPYYLDRDKGLASGKKDHKNRLRSKTSSISFFVPGSTPRIITDENTTRKGYFNSSYVAAIYHGEDDDLLLFIITTSFFGTA